jgi:hypothetical protein
MFRGPQKLTNKAGGIRTSGEKNLGYTFLFYNKKRPHLALAVLHFSGKLDPLMLQTKELP